MNDLINNLKTAATEMGLKCGNGRYYDHSHSLGERRIFNIKNPSGSGEMVVDLLEAMDTTSDTYEVIVGGSINTINITIQMKLEARIAYREAQSA